MLGYAALLAVSLLWFLASGLFGPNLLKLLPRRLHPRSHVLFWLGGLYSLIFSGLTALLAAGVIIVVSWADLDRADRGVSDLWYIVLVSILPYVALAGVGSAIALVLTRLEPARAAAKETTELLLLASTPAGDFHGLPVSVLDAPYLAAALVDIHRRPTILITSFAKAQLLPDQLEAVYWHELGHAVGEHNGLNRIARVASALAPRLPLTRALPAAVAQLCEAWADQYALTKVNPDSLMSARALFEF
ncbi:MAG: hypothetical protein RJA35_489 [Actinomycetota bacterium]|jgi:Zn-dependent protease with chaperone function